MTPLSLNPLTDGEGGSSPAGAALRVRLMSQSEISFHYRGDLIVLHNLENTFQSVRAQREAATKLFCASHFFKHTFRTSHRIASFCFPTSLPSPKKDGKNTSHTQRIKKMNDLQSNAPGLVQPNDAKIQDETQRYFTERRKTGFVRLNR